MAQNCDIFTRNNRETEKPIATEGYKCEKSRRFCTITGNISAKHGLACRIRNRNSSFDRTNTHTYLSPYNNGVCMWRSGWGGLDLIVVAT